MSSQYPFPQCSDSKPKVTWLFHAAKVQLFFETTKFYGIFSVTITIISIFSCCFWCFFSRSSLGCESVIGRRECSRSSRGGSDQRCTCQCHRRRQSCQTNQDDRIIKIIPSKPKNPCIPCTCGIFFVPLHAF